jgi:hypothetical protein
MDWGVLLMTEAEETSHPEGRSQPVRNPGEKANDRTQGRGILPAKLARVKEATRGSRQTRFTALLHHLGIPRWRRILTLWRFERFASRDQGIYGHLTWRNLAVLAAERGDRAEAGQPTTQGTWSRTWSMSASASRQRT